MRDMRCGQLASIEAAIKWKTRKMVGGSPKRAHFGTETTGTDYGQAQHFNPPYPAHFYMHGKGRFGSQCLTNLDKPPPKGAVGFSAPLKIKQGSASPLRVLALVEAALTSARRKLPSS